MHAVSTTPFCATGRHLVLGLGLLHLLVAACTTRDPATTCGEGTVLTEGRCVSDVTPHVCGPGTILQGSECVLDLTAIPKDTGEPDADEPDDDVSMQDVTEPPTDDTTLDEDVPLLECPDGCPDGQLCFEGECVVPEEAPIYWFCIENLYADGYFCDCECGFPDPDCADPALPVQGCDGAAACGSDGFCGECIPVCDGLACGSDGCGGSCGDCTGEGEICSSGQCEMCTPSCEGLECGDDGCGGSCGECEGILACFEGLCAPPAPDASCEGHCGDVTESGCWCTSDCETYGDCCADVEFCACGSGCAGVDCGDDGCGGSCGECEEGAACEDGLCVILPSCVETGCGDHGDCDEASGDCDCDVGFTGGLCDACAPGHTGFPLCGFVCTADDQCGDGDDCTEDACTPDFGCLNVRSPLPCDDGDPCTADDTCGDDGCVGIDDGCDDGNACTTDACSASGCVHSPSGAVTCDDNDPCTAVDTCAGTVCYGAGAVTCDDGSMCTIDACVPGEGCVYEPVPDDAPCDTGDLCVYEAACEAGVCKAVRRRSCHDGDPCTADDCAPATGECTNPALSDGDACDDERPCTVGEACSSGACVPEATVCLLPAAMPIVHYSAFTYGALDLDETTGDVYGWLDENVAGYLQAGVEGELPTWEAEAVNGRPGVRLANGAALSSELPGDGTTPVSLFAVLCLGKAGSGTYATIASVGPASQPSTWLARVGDGLVGSAGGEDGWLATESSGCLVVAVEYRPEGVELSLVSGDTSESEVVDTVLPPFLTADDVLRIGGSKRTLVLGELLIYDEVLDARSRADVISTLRRAWGFPVPVADAAYDPDNDDRVSPVDPPPFDDLTLVKELESENDGPPLTCSTPESYCPVLLEPNQYSDNVGVGYYPNPETLPLNAYAGVLTDSAFTMVAAMRLDVPSEDGVLLRLEAGDTALALTQSNCEGCDGEVRWGDADELGGGAFLSWPIGTAIWRVVTTTADGTGACTVSLDDGSTEAAECQAPPDDQDAILDVGSYEEPGSELDDLATRPMGGAVGELRFFLRSLHPLDRAYVERLIAWKYSIW
ncbi:MAG: hypothetical protein IV100_21960 [Myxococcales bacterium]|nr:hypothetical protein [Myxococcales bacterium]